MEQTPLSNRLELRGIGVSSGIGYGRARVMAKAPLQLPQYSIEDDKIDAELKRFDKARSAVNREIAGMIRRAPKRAPKEMKSFLEMFKQLVNDPMLRDSTEQLVREQHINVEWALAQYLEETKKVFENFPDSYLAERGDDIGHAVNRLQEELLGTRRRLQDAVKAEVGEVVLVTSDLSLADVIWLTEYEELDLVGIVTERGGATSHAAVLSQTLFIPAIVGVAGAREQIKNGEKLYIDSDTGTLICNPTEQEEKEILDKVEEQEQTYSRYYRARRRVAETTDHFKMKLYANVAMCTGLDEVLHQGAQGIGLFRSEYLFMGRDDLPDEEEQFKEYCELIRAMGGRVVTIRTLDVGGDKILNQEARQRDPVLRDHAQEEENPALGLRAIRFSLVNPDLFLTQLKAILRASAFGKVKIMFPMITTLEEIREAKRYVELAKQQLREKEIAFDEKIPLGIMIELPAIAYKPAPFLKEVDFASIGTNDLIQYTLAVDRGNSLVAPLYESCHPAILGMIANVARTARRLKKTLSICGEMGGHPEMAPFFIGIGVPELSMAALQIPQVKEIIRSVSKQECERFAKRLLSMSETTRIKTAINKFVSNRHD